MHRLSLLSEFKVGEGRLFICMANISSDSVPLASKKLYHAIRSYMESPDFTPQNNLEGMDLMKLFRDSGAEVTIQGIKNVSYE